jgi:hypothetical protein
MGCIDDGVDALARDIGSQTRRVAEAADPLRDRRRGGVGGCARERQNGGDIRVTGDPPRQRVRFRRAAKNEQTKAVQRAAP